MGSIREQIEQRAYELFLERGGVHGYHMEDWLQAEREIAGETGAMGKITTVSPAARKPAPSKSVSIKARKRK